MSAYRTVVVGTDGSDSSLLAVRRAGALAGACRARLVIVCAYLPPRADERERFVAHLSANPAEAAVRTQEAIWALLCCSEFRFNR